MMDLSMELDASTFPLAKDDNLEVDWKPRVGMKFDNLETAWKLWVDYGGKAGFGVRKQYFNKSKKDGSITSCRFVCCKEGRRKEDKRDFLTTNPRLETRTDCKARMTLTKMNGKFEVHEFIEEHNHLLQLPETTHMLASQRKKSRVQTRQIDLTDDSKLLQIEPFQLMTPNVGDTTNLKYTQLDEKSNLRSKRQRNLIYGEVDCLLEYFQEKMLENPLFYHASQMDIEGQITNVFWADGKMLIDYGCFGDVVSFNTTYCTNNAHRPLVLFSGFNHFRGVVIFGAALLYDRTVESFKWLFETFLEAHKQKRPQTTFTDEDQVMTRALYEVMPETCHALCTWNLMQNAIKHLGNLTKNGSHFLSDFKDCIYEYEEEVQFEVAWNELLSKYDVRENIWLRSVYAVKEKWAACYMKKVFTLGIRSTLSKCLHPKFKACMKPDVNIIQFFQHFERAVENKRYNELKCEFESRHKVPRLKCEYSPMLQQLAQIYTFTIFDLFQTEFDLSFAACIKYRNESQPMFEYTITLVDQKGEWRVLFDPCHKSISCNCGKFETFGLLCCHALKVYSVKDIKLIPDKYILKRWTKDARSDIIHHVEGKDVVGDAKVDST